MKIYTKTGDKGYTSLIGGTRVPKYHTRIESYGTVDELNAYIGLISGQDVPATLRLFLKRIQDNLFIIGSLLAADPEVSKMKLPELKPREVQELEKAIDILTAGLPELRHFILPGGSDVVSFCHIARCVCRRAERAVVLLSESSVVDQQVIVYLNRLSDYLFMLARKLLSDSGLPENKWMPAI